MYVTECSIGTEAINPTSAHDEIMHCYREIKGSNGIEQLRLIAGLCNSSEFDVATDNLALHERKINGDATDQAILRFSESLGPVSELQQSWRKNFELAFNSKNKFMIRTLSLVEEDGLNYAFSNAEAATFTLDDMYVLNCSDMLCLDLLMFAGF
jgi:sodium/potassium-transporting ATPase subunit alpha